MNISNYNSRASCSRPKASTQTFRMATGFYVRYFCESGHWLRTTVLARKVRFCAFLVADLTNCTFLIARTSIVSGPAIA